MVIFYMSVQPDRTAGINNTKYSVATENGQTIAKRC